MQTTSAYTPLAERLRHYTPALASLSRALFDARGALRGSARAAPHPVATPAARRALRLTISSDQGALCLQVDAGAHAALEAVALEADGARRGALAGLWLADPLAALARHGAAQPAVLDLRLASAAPAAAGALHIDYEHAGHAASASVLDASDALAAALAARIGPAGPGAARLAPVPAALAELALPTRLRLRSRLATPALLRALRPGDVLLGWPGAPGFGPHAKLDQATVLWGAPNGHAVHAQARIDSRNVILESIPAMMNDDPDLSLRAAGASPAPIDVNEVELPVHIEVVTVNLPIGQIAALQPGVILTLPLNLADAEIRLVAHGQSLAFGELVAVGDQLGLHIRRIASSDERRS